MHPVSHFNRVLSRCTLLYFRISLITWSGRYASRVCLSLSRPSLCCFDPLPPTPWRVRRVHTSNLFTTCRRGLIHVYLPLHAISIASSSLAIVVVRIPSLLHLINISVTGTHDLIGRDAECASGFSVAHAHASLNTSSPSYASRPKSAIYASVYRRYLSVLSALATLVLPHIDICHD